MLRPEAEWAGRGWDAWCVVRGAWCVVRRLCESGHVILPPALRGEAGGPMRQHRNGRWGAGQVEAWVCYRRPSPHRPVPTLTRSASPLPPAPRVEGLAWFSCLPFLVLRDSRLRSFLRMRNSPAPLLSVLSSSRLHHPPPATPALMLRCGAKRSLEGRGREGEEQTWRQPRPAADRRRAWARRGWAGRARRVCGHLRVVRYKITVTGLRCRPRVFSAA